MDTTKIPSTTNNSSTKGPPQQKRSLNHATTTTTHKRVRVEEPHAVKKTTTTQHDHLSNLRTELDLLQRLIYKNCNQHRRAEYFMGLRMLRAAGQKAMDGQYGDSKIFFMKLKNIDNINEAKEEKDELAMHVMKCAESIRQWNVTRHKGLYAANKLATLISQRFFLTFAMVAASISSYCAVIANDMASELLDVFASMIAAWFRKLRHLHTKQDVVPKRLVRLARHACTTVCEARRRIPYDASPLRDDVDTTTTTSLPVIKSSTNTAADDGNDDEDIGIAM